MERVAGIQTGGSERAFDLYMKARYLDEKHPGHGVVFATGHADQQHDGRDVHACSATSTRRGSASRGIEHFDAWAATFGEVVETMEISPGRRHAQAPQPLRQVREPARAGPDVPGLRRRADGGDARPAPAEAGRRQAADHRLPDVGGADRSCRPGWSKRYDRIRNEKVDPREDNALAITTDGRKLALDGRMLQPGPDFPGSKINALVGNVVRIWQKTEPTRGTQMIFCDMGVNPTPWGFSAYDEVVEKLVDHGIPRHQIAIMGDADTDAKKQALFEKVRQGTVRVLIGSTAKMGTGTNVQKRLVALHHLDAPWKPAEVEQREGRILRQGNKNEEVAIYRYVTEGSFDAYMWQALGDESPVHRPGHERRLRRQEGRGHRRPGTQLRRGEGHRLGQPGRADAGRGRRRAAAAGDPAEEPPRRAVPGPAEPPRPAGRHQAAGEAAGRPDGRHGDHGGERRHPVAGGGRQPHEAGCPRR